MDTPRDRLIVSVIFVAFLAVVIVAFVWLVWWFFSQTSPGAALGHLIVSNGHYLVHGLKEAFDDHRSQIDEWLHDHPLK